VHEATATSVVAAPLIARSIRRYRS